MGMLRRVAAATSLISSSFVPRTAAINPPTDKHGLVAEIRIK